MVDAVSIFLETALLEKLELTDTRTKLSCIPKEVVQRVTDRLLERRMRLP